MTGASNTRKRITIAAIATGVVIVVVAAVIVVDTRHAGPTHEPSKEVALARLTRVDDAVVVPGDGDLQHVESILDGTDAVAQWATLPLGTLATALHSEIASDAKTMFKQLCKDPTMRAIAVHVDRSVPHEIGQLSKALGTRATALTIAKPDVDAEVFMQVKATPTEVATVHGKIAADPDVTKDTYIDHDAALAEFKKLFAGEPKMIASTSAAQLPESFQLQIGPGVSIDRVANRYRRLPGVDMVTEPGTDKQLPATGDKTLPSGTAEIFMDVHLADHNAMTDAIATQLRIDPRVRTFVFIDHDGAYDQFKKLFAGPGDRQMVQSTKPGNLPTSFDVFLRSQHDAAAFEKNYAKASGVDSVRISTSTLTAACTPDP